MNLVNECYAQTNKLHDEQAMTNTTIATSQGVTNMKGKIKKKVMSPTGITDGTNHQLELESSIMRMAQDIQMMNDKMDMMMNAIRGRVSTNLDELVHHTNSLFIAHVTSCPLLPKFRMSQVETYDRLKDPLDHLESFKTLMHLQGVLDEIMCRGSPTTLKGLAKVWFDKITPNSISTFKELNGHFVMPLVDKDTRGSRRVS